MITRKRTLVSLSILTLAGLAALPELAHARPPQASLEAPNRQLMLHIADGFRRQTWTTRGRTWDEHSDTIMLRRHETIRLSLVNDTHDTVQLPAAGPFGGASLDAGEIISVTLQVNSPDGFNIQAISQGTGLTKACSRYLRRFEIGES